VIAALLELPPPLGSAQSSICPSVYADFDGPRAFQVLARRMDAVADLRVTLLLNIQRKPRDTTAADQLVRNVAEKLWTSDWPGSRKPSVYDHPRSLELGRPGGVLHAVAAAAMRFLLPPAPRSLGHEL
jgi:hypothetical protein